ESIGAIPPSAVFISLATIATAPTATVAAGIGDLLANPVALRDWKLASVHGLAEIDQPAWDMSAQSYELISGDLDRPIAELAADAAFIRRLSDALILSGTAMIEAGTSRPASGGEHEISHAIDHLYGGRAMHGAQVAFATVISLALYGEDTERFRRTLAGLGLPTEPADLGFDADDLVQVLLEAPNTRPGRFTIIEEANLEADSARRLINDIWP
ncbi:MAG TPA: iron-containing alcohol dehydrogenase, partial [Actinomycetota bacterium]|nr:iron-containing alcohol dehydrogenase [Actinomycetota bacterium]